MNTDCIQAVINTSSIGTCDNEPIIFYQTKAPVHHRFNAGYQTCITHTDYHGIAQASAQWW